MEQSVRSVHSIDVWRVVASFLVVAVHFPLPGVYGGIAITYGKTAVPFFIIVSGYFCYREDRDEFAKRLLKQMGKLLLLDIMANLLFLVISYVGSGASSWTIYKIMIMSPDSWKKFFLVNQSPFADHLWFLGSMVYAMTIIWVLNRLRIDKYAFYLAPILLGIYIYLARTGNYDFIYIRNALICTMPYFMYGCLIRRFEDKILAKLHGGVIIGVVLACTAISFFEFWHFKDVGMTFIGPELLDIALVLMLLKYKNFGRNSVFEWIGRRDTLFIYIMHFILVMYFYRNYWSNAPKIVENYGTVIIFVSTLLVAEIYAWMKAGIRYGIRRVRKQSDVGVKSML